VGSLDRTARRHPYGFRAASANDAKRDHLTLTIGSQAVIDCAKLLADGPEDRSKDVRICPDVGGGFAPLFLSEYALIAVAARACKDDQVDGRPCRCFMGDAQGATTSPRRG
jgi:hypothetical protein